MANILLTVLPFALTFTIASWQPKSSLSNHLPTRQSACPGGAICC